MKNFKFLPFCLIILFNVNNIYSQNYENSGYIKNNRYAQNESYNLSIVQTINGNISSKTNQLQINEDFVELEINALYNAKANSYLAILSIIQKGATAIAVDSMINIRYNGFCKDLSKFGITNDDIFIDMISMVPIYETQVDKKLFSKTYNEVPVGFTLQKNIHVYYKKGDMLDKILTAASKHEIYDLIKVEYFVDNTEAIYDTLTDISLIALNKKIEKLKKLGIVLDTLKRRYSDQKTVLFPVDNYKSYNSYGGISLTTGEKGLVNETKITPTMFYNKVPYHKYDIVINPSFKEPAVQYSYNIIVRYYLNPEKEEEPVVKEVVKNIYHIVTPEGEVKKLNTE